MVATTILVGAYVLPEKFQCNSILRFKFPMQKKIYSEDSSSITLDNRIIQSFSISVAKNVKGESLLHNFDRGSISSRHDIIKPPICISKQYLHINQAHTCSSGLKSNDIPFQTHFCIYIYIGS